MAKPDLRTYESMAGDTFVLNFVVRAAGTPVDLTGCTVRMVFARRGAPSVEASVALASDLTTGAGSATLSHAQTASMLDAYIADMVLTDSLAAQTTIAHVQVTFFERTV